MIGIEDGVRRALTAYLAERGASAETAAAKSEENLAAGVALVRSSIEGSRSPDQRERFFSAMRELKTWSASIEV